MAEEATLRNLLLDFFIAGCPQDIESSLPRSRPVVYEGHEDLAQSLSPRLMCSMDACEILAVTRENQWAARSVSVQTFWTAALAALLLVEPDVVAGNRDTGGPGPGDNGNGTGGGGPANRPALYSHAVQIAETLRPAFARTERRRVVVAHLAGKARGAELTLCVRKC